MPAALCVATCRLVARRFRARRPCRGLAALSPAAGAGGADAVAVVQAAAAAAAASGGAVAAAA
eukprot:82399-Chlamydomonas_euryale.AAC.2